jgi:hypothetical protein
MQQFCQDHFHKHARHVTIPESFFIDFMWFNPGCTPPKLDTAKPAIAELDSKALSLSVIGKLGFSTISGFFQMVETGAIVDMKDPVFEYQGPLNRVPGK